MSLAPRALLAAVLVAGCSSSAPTAPPSTFAPTDAPATEHGATTGPTATPLPNGLAYRPGMPELVDGEANSCLPLCRAKVATAGPFEIGVRYQTKYFFGGYLTVTPMREWQGGEDSTGELGFFSPNDGEYGIKFAMDLWPVTDRQRVEGVPNTADGLIGWLRDNPRYSISDEIPASIGSIPAIAIDVWNSSKAPSQYEDCLGEPCSDMFGFEQFQDYGGILGDDVYRFVFADVEFSGTRHVLVVVMEARDRADLDSRIPAAEELLATVTVPAHAAGIPGQIVFARYVIALENDEVYVIRADGTDEHKLVNGGHQCPRWSRDGLRIAMTGEMTPLLVSPSGDTITETDSPDGKLFLGCGAFSPAGDTYAAEGWDDADASRRGIYTIRLAGPGGIRRLTTAPAGSTDIPGAYSPDGMWLSFTRDGNLMLVRADGTDIREIARGSYGVPDWSPDGRSLIADSLGDLYVIDVDLEGTHERVSPRRLTSDAPDYDGEKGAPIWSPDGRWIAFSMENPGPWADIWVMRLDGSWLTRLTHHPQTDNIAGSWVP